MSKIILLRGLPASGKSTWAKEFVEKNPSYKRINKDELREMLDLSKWSGKNESFVLKVRDFIIEQALKDGFNVIVDDTNLHEKHIERMREIVANRLLAGRKDVEIEEKFFDIALDEAIKRDSLRQKPVGAKVIRSMYERWIKPNIKKVVLQQDHQLPHAIICDIDGTIAEMHNRSPYDETKVLDDKPKKEIIKILNSFTHANQVQVIFFSGRKESCRLDTIKWLNENVFGVFENEAQFIDRDGVVSLYHLEYSLFMRSSDDNRKDSIVKRELFDKHIRGKYYIDFVLDDRNQVVDMWRNEIGLTCLQVQTGDF